MATPIAQPAHIINDPLYREARLISELDRVTISYAIKMLRKYETPRSARQAIQLDRLFTESQTTFTNKRPA